MIDFDERKFSKIDEISGNEIWKFFKSMEVKGIENE